MRNIKLRKSEDTILKYNSILLSGKNTPKIKICKNYSKISKTAKILLSDLIIKKQKNEYLKALTSYNNYFNLQSPSPNIKERNISVNIIKLYFYHNNIKDIIIEDFFILSLHLIDKI